MKNFVDGYKNKPCTDCDIQYPIECMDFDHLFDKVDKISNLAHNCLNHETVLLEINKCEVVCANCHRIRTKNRGYNNCI